MASVGGQKLRVTLIQLEAKSNRTETLNHLKEMVAKAVAGFKPRVIALPEGFGYDYEGSYKAFNDAAETIENSESVRVLSGLAKQYNIYIVGGAIVEKEGDKIYNASLVFNPQGRLVAKHRKVHLCNIHMPCPIAKMTCDLDEVSFLTPGDAVTTFDLDGIKCGVLICNDSRFDEFVRCYRKVGCDLLFIPAAYDDVLGVNFWEPVHRARAIDNQMYVFVLSSARKENVDFKLYGRTQIINPVGIILKQAGVKEEIVSEEIDLGFLSVTRKQMPLAQSRRLDIYKKYTDL